MLIDYVISPVGVVELGQDLSNQLLRVPSDVSHIYIETGFKNLWLVSASSNTVLSIFRARPSPVIRTISHHFSDSRRRTRKPCRRVTLAPPPQTRSQRAGPGSGQPYFLVLFSCGSRRDNWPLCLKRPSFRWSLRALCVIRVFLLSPRTACFALKTFWIGHHFGIRELLVMFAISRGTSHVFWLGFVSTVAL